MKLFTKINADMICPVTGLHCEDECCTIDSECNLSDSNTQESPEEKDDGGCLMEV